MQLNLDRGDTKYMVTKYVPGCITVNEEEFTQSLLLMPDYCRSWQIDSIGQLQATDLLELLKLEPQLILLGTGNNLLFPASNITEAVIQRNIGIEVMSTQAACRTFAVLAAEGRKVLAALIID